MKVSNFDVPQTLSTAVDFYQHDLPFHALFSTEYGMWVRKWKGHSSEVPHKMIDALKVCDNTSYPNIYLLLQLSLTLPITSCESERSFSQLKLLKISHQSTMTSNRLSSLAILKQNVNICNVHLLSEMVQTFKQLYPRRMKLPFMLLESDNIDNGQESTDW